MDPRAPGTRGGDTQASAAFPRLGRQSAGPRARGPGLLTSLLVGLLAGTGSVFTLPSPCPAQLPSASARVWALGGLSTASVRGFGAIGTNPAGLAMPRSPDLTLTALPVSPDALRWYLLAALDGGMRPVTFGDLNDWTGSDIPPPVREAWLQRIEGVGRQRGSVSLALTPIALARGSYGFQLTTSGVVQTSLNPDAAELLLFGNAGRTGEPEEFQLAGSTLDAWALTSAAFAGAIPLGIEIGDAPGQSFAVGATLKLTLGHALFLGRDVGSTFAGEPTQLASRFPVIQTDTSYRSLDNGRGVGLDVGFQWESPRWGAGLALENLVQTFAWEREGLWFRPGTALFDADLSESDFGARPAREAPLALREAVTDFSLGRTLSVGVVHRPGERLLLGGEVKARFAAQPARGPPLEVGATVEALPTPRLPLLGHLAIVRGGARMGGGATWVAGRFQLSSAISRLTGEIDSTLWMFALSLGGP